MQQGATFSWTITRKQVSRDFWLVRSRPVIAHWMAYEQNLFQNYTWAFLATWDKMVMKCLPKCGQIYYQEEPLPTTNWCLLRAFGGEGNGNPLQYSHHGWRSLVSAAVHAVAKSQTGLNNFTFTFMHWRRKWQLTPVFSPRESQGRGSLVGCYLWGRTESDTTEVT